MGLGGKAKAAAKAKAQAQANRLGKKILHGGNHCSKSPSDRHQYGIEKITTEDDEGVKHTFRMLACRHCSQPKKNQTVW